MRGAVVYASAAPAPAHVTCPEHGNQTRTGRKAAKVQQQGTKSPHWFPEEVAMWADDPAYQEYAKKQLEKARGMAQSASRLKLRELALLRDGYQCQLRISRRCTGYADTVHLAPRLAGNHRIATLEDCTSACRSCHGTIDAPRARA